MIKSTDTSFTLTRVTGNKAFESDLLSVAGEIRKPCGRESEMSSQERELRTVQLECLNAALLYLLSYILNCVTADEGV